MIRKFYALIKADNIDGYDIWEMDELGFIDYKNEHTPYIRIYNQETPNVYLFVSKHNLFGIQIEEIEEETKEGEL